MHRIRLIAATVAVLAASMPSLASAQANINVNVHGPSSLEAQTLGDAQADLNIYCGGSDTQLMMLGAGGPFELEVCAPGSSNVVFTGMCPAWMMPAPVTFTTPNALNIAVVRCIPRPVMY